MSVQYRGEGSGQKSSLHAVIVPFPAQGHVTPCLQLARKLVRLGFRITFVNTTHNHDRMMKSQPGAMQSESETKFVAVPDGLPDDHPRLADVCAFCDATLKMGPAFEDLFAALLIETPITCVIGDVSMPSAHEGARKVGIPVVGFMTPSAISIQCYYHIPAFIAAGMLPLPPPPDPSFPSLDPINLYLRPAQSDADAAARRRPLTCLPGVSPDLMRVEDIPTFVLSHDLDSFFLGFFQEHQNPSLPKCVCILLNTFYKLEADVIDAMGDINSRLYPIGPLVFEPATSSSDQEPRLVGVGSALWEEDRTSLQWLDDQKTSSVVYVSFGSIATISFEQIQELAYGLEMGQHPFLWVIRPDLVANGDDAGNKEEFQTMFSEFVQRTKDRALLLPWVPQPAVLSHPAVGAFITHCGWNSTIESIASGVAMLGWPKFADQNTNCRYITHVWKIGLDFESRGKDGLVVKQEVAKKVSKIMAKEGTDPEVDCIKKNCKELQSAARKAVLPGGTSQRALLKFVQQLRQTEDHQVGANGHHLHSFT